MKLKACLFLVFPLLACGNGDDLRDIKPDMVKKVRNDTFISDIKRKVPKNINDIPNPADVVKKTILNSTAEKPIEVAQKSKPTPSPSNNAKPPVYKTSQPETKPDTGIQEPEIIEPLVDLNFEPRTPDEVRIYVAQLYKQCVQYIDSKPQDVHFYLDRALKFKDDGVFNLFEAMIFFKKRDYNTAFTKASIAKKRGSDLFQQNSMVSLLYMVKCKEIINDKTPSQMAKDTWFSYYQQYLKIDPFINWKLPRIDDEFKHGVYFK